MVFIIKNRFKSTNLSRGEKYLVAYIKGNKENSSIKGMVKFIEKPSGTLVVLEISGLPNKEKNNFFGFHIHSGGECVQNNGEAFSSALSHFDLENNKHPNHSGDLPMIYSNDGYAYMQFYTNRFNINHIINKTVIIHELEDDLKTDPAGNSGMRIACGVIK